MIRLPLLAVVALTLVSCDDQKNWEAPPLETSPMGIKVYVPPEAAATFGRENVVLWVDLQAQNWIREKSTWGMDAYTDAEMWEFARQLPVIGFDGDSVPGGGSAHGGEYGGFNWYGSRIEVAVFSPRVTAADVTIARYFGFPFLPHEFTHTARGAFHP